MNQDEMSASTNSANARFWDKVATRYSTRPISDQALYEKKLALTQKHFTPESRVLEYGCGTGTTALIHADHVGEIIATDISSAMIDIANGKKEEQGVTNVEFKACSLWELEYETETFDAVLALNILHLLEDYQEHVDRSYELLKPGGVFVSSTACLTSPLIKILVAVMRFFGLAPRVMFFSAKDLEASMISRGFEVVDKIEIKRGLFLIARRPEQASI